MVVYFTFFYKNKLYEKNEAEIAITVCSWEVQNKNKKLSLFNSIFPKSKLKRFTAILRDLEEYMEVIMYKIALLLQH